MPYELNKEFDYYLEHQAEFVEKYNGKVVVIKGCEVIGVYLTEGEAVGNTIKQHELGTFLVQKCESGEDNYTMTFNSRVEFA